LVEPRDTPVASTVNPLAVSLPAAAALPVTIPAVAPVQPEAHKDNKAAPEKVASLAS